MYKKANRLISVILVLTLCIQLCSGLAFGAEATEAVWDVNEKDSVTGITEPGMAEENDATQQITDEAQVLYEEEPLRAESSKHFRMSDGSNIAVQYDTAVHYMADGAWTDIDNTLKLDRGDDNSRRYTAKNGDHIVSFPERLEDNSVCDVSDGTYRVSMYLDNDLGKAEAVIVERSKTDGSDFYDHIRPAALDADITYKSVYDGVDIQYHLHGFHLKENIIVNRPQPSYKFSFTLRLENLDPVLDEESGSLLLMGKDGPVYEIPRLYMTDTKGEASNDVSYTLERSARDTYTFVITADEKWMNAEDRAFPVTIDPTLYNTTVGLSDAITSTYVTSGSPNMTHTNYQSLYVGNSSLSSEGYNQIYLNINTLPEIPKNCVVTDAQIAYACMEFSTTGTSAARIYAYPCYDSTSGYTYRYTVQNMTYNNKLARYDNALDYRTLAASDVYTYVSWDVVRAAQEWYKTRTNLYANHVIKLQATDLANYVMVRFAGYGASSPAYFIVQYRNVVGLEDYYTYQQQSVDRAGTVYVSDFTQQMTVTHPDTTIDLGDTSFTLYHVYNSANRASQNTYNPTEGVHARTFTSMNTGLGWKLSAQETVDWIDVGSTYYIVYSDPDGTEHYFSKNTSTNVWEDEDGLDLRITVSSSGDTDTFTMTNKNGDFTKEFYNGYLTTVTDSNGNKFFYAYGTSYSPSGTSWKPSRSNHQLKEIVRQTNGASWFVVAALTYSDGFLDTITDHAGRTTSFHYDLSDHLTRITHPDGTEANYEYNFSNDNDCLTKIKDDESGYALAFGYEENNLSSYIVGSVTEHAGTVSGASYTVTRDTAQKMHYRFCGADRTLNTSDDLVTYNLFDYWGRTINRYTLNNDETKRLGASSAAYTANSGTSSQNNRLSSSAVSGIHGQNLLKDGGLEHNSSIGAWYSSGGTATVASSSGTITPHLGSKMIVVTGSASGTVKMCQDVTLTAGKTYTFSGYVNTGGMTVGTGSAYLSLGSKTSDAVNYQTSASIEDGWEKLSVTFTCTSTGTYAAALCAKNAAGVVCGDDFQLEEGDAATGVNLIQGGDFDTAHNYAYWTRNTDSTYISRNTTDPHDGTWSMKLIGSPTSQRWCYQSVPINKPAAGRTFILSGWGRAESTAYPQYGSDRYFSLYGVIHYTDGTSESNRIDFNYSCTDWQYGSLAIVPKSQTKTISRIEVSLSYHYNTNAAFFDDISLVMEPSQTYQLDSDGNVVSAIDSNGKTSYTYESGTTRLTAYTDLAGVSYDLTYDTSTHNLTKVSSAGVTIDNTYNNAGNLTEAKTTASGTNDFLQTETTYTINGHPYSQKDANEVERRWSYSATHHRLISSALYNGDDTLWQEYSYCENSDRLSKTYYDTIISLEYEYSDGMLNRLVRDASRNNSPIWQRYSFARDAFGNVTGITVSKSFNGSSWSTGQTLASYAYAANNGHLTRMTYGNGAYIDYTYDMFDRVTQQTYNDGTTYRYVYNADGDLAEQSVDGGNRYSFMYDSLGRLIHSKETDASGNLIQRTQHVYDSANRLTAQSWQIGSDSFSESYAYDSTDGKLSTMNTGAGTEITYNYDELKRLTSESSAPYTRTYTYRDSTATTNRTTLQVSDLSYNVADVSFQYTYNALGDIAQIVEQYGPTTTYHYDNRRQLTEATIGDNIYAYTYDTAGNLLTKTDNGVTHTYTYGNANWADLLTIYDNVILLYDNIGNPTSYYNGEAYAMTWAKGRQLSAFTKGSTSASYTYDMDGVRSSKTVGNATTSFITQNGLVVRQTTGTSSIDFVYDSQQRPYAMRYNNVWYYYLLNLQGDVVKIVDGSGNEVAAYTYDPWGKVLSATDNTIAAINPLRYRGYYYDTESGFYYLQSRYYDPNIGRFINADGPEISVFSAINIKDSNLFSYCANNTVSHSDNSGYFINTIIGAIVGGIVTAVTTDRSDENYVEKVFLGAAAGAISGAAVDIAIATGGVAAPLLIAAVGGAVANGVNYAGTQALDGEEVDPVEMSVNMAVGAVLNLVAYGASVPSNRITSEGTLSTRILNNSQNALTEGTTRTVVSTGKKYVVSEAVYSSTVRANLATSSGVSVVTSVFNWAYSLVARRMTK